LRDVWRSRSGRVNDKSLINFRRTCDGNVDFLGGDSQNSKQVDAIVGYIGNFVSVKLVVEFEGERELVIAKELKIAE
jgi:hypothetical protein